MERKSMQKVEDIELWYQTPDPWEYKTNGYDHLRKEKILFALRGKEYKRALDIGCGEGWITKDLPADEIEGYEISENASKRFPKNVKRTENPKGKYDLIVATGVLYSHYDFHEFIDIILRHATGTVLISSIKEWEVNLDRLGSPVSSEEFPYREYTQTMKLYDFTA